MALTAGTPLDVLTDRLQKAGWGDLGEPSMRGLARVLDALAASLNPRSGAGKTTALQLAERTCYSERWVRRCLTLLEELDVIIWHRGGICNGKPTPSWIRVSKTVLVDLVHIARAKQGERLTEQAQAQRRRLAGLRTTSTHHRRRAPQDRKQPRRHKGGTHAELGSDLLSYSEEVPTAACGPAGARQAEEPNNQKDEAPASTDVAQSAIARIRADLAARRGRKDRKSAATR